VSPLLKKSSLDNGQLSNCRLNPNLSLISKIIKLVVKSRLTDHLTSNKLLNPPVCLLQTPFHWNSHLVFTIISSMQYDHKSYHVFVSSTFLLHLTPSTIASYSLAFYLRSSPMALSSTGLSPTCHLAPYVSDVITIPRPCILPPCSRLQVNDNWQFKRIFFIQGPRYTSGGPRYTPRGHGTSKSPIPRYA